MELKISIIVHIAKINGNMTKLLKVKRISKNSKIYGINKNIPAVKIRKIIDALKTNGISLFIVIPFLRALIFHSLILKQACLATRLFQVLPEL